MAVVPGTGRMPLAFGPQYRWMALQVMSEVVNETMSPRLRSYSLLLLAMGSVLVAIPSHAFVAAFYAFMPGPLAGRSCGIKSRPGCIGHVTGNDGTVPGSSKLLMGMCLPAMPGSLFEIRLAIYSQQLPYFGMRNSIGYIPLHGRLSVNGFTRYVSPSQAVPVLILKVRKSPVFSLLPDGVNVTELTDISVPPRVRPADCCY